MLTRFISRRIAVAGVLGVGMVAATATPAGAVFIDEFDDGNPLTNGSGTVWQQYAFSSVDEAGAPAYPFTVEPGRNGPGTIELASQNGKNQLGTINALPELNFLGGPTRLTVNGFNTSRYQDGVLQGGNVTFGNGFIFISSTQGSDFGINDAIMVRKDNASFAIVSEINNASTTLGTITQLVNPGNPGDVSNVTHSPTVDYDIVIDLDPTNVTVTIADAQGRVSSITAAHNQMLANWDLASGDAFLGFGNLSAAVAGRGASTSVSFIQAGIPEPASAGLAAIAGLAMLARRRRGR